MAVGVAVLVGVEVGGNSVGDGGTMVAVSVRSGVSVGVGLGVDVGAISVGVGKALTLHPQEITSNPNSSKTMAATRFMAG